MVLNAGYQDRPTPGALLAAIMDGTEDAIVSKALDGTILTWNRAAESLFGHSAKEAVGQPISILFPEDRRDEEREIIAKLRLGKRYQKHETVRRTKKGDLIELSVTISPVLAEDGKVVGATKIARDITVLRDAERHALLARELNHRIKNLFALTTSLVSQSAREAATVAELEATLNARLFALARAHDLTLPDLGASASQEVSTTLLSLVSALLAPYQGETISRVEVSGADVEIGRNALTSLALVLHELVTNAVKYGGLSTAEGHLSVEVVVEQSMVRIVWAERGSPAPTLPIGSEGFGSHLERACLKGIGASLSRDWRPEGLFAILAISVERIRE